MTVADGKISDVFYLTFFGNGTAAVPFSFSSRCSLFFSTDTLSAGGWFCSNLMENTEIDCHVQQTLIEFFSFSPSSRSTRRL